MPGWKVSRSPRLSVQPALAKDRNVLLCDVKAGGYTIVNNQWRYIHYADGTEELYDVVKDPNEWDNLAPQEKYRTVMEELRKSAPKTFAAPGPETKDLRLVTEGERFHWELKDAVTQEKDQSRQVTPTHLFMKTPTLRTLLFTLLVAPAAVLSQAATTPRPPNVVVIIADDLGYADISRNATPGKFRHTPNLDRLCNEGIFLQNYVTHHVCSPSRAGILTGRHYTRVGAGVEVGGTLDNTIPNVAKNLQAAGYTTATFGKWHNCFRPMSDNGKSVKVATRAQVIPDDDTYQDFKNIAWGEGVNAYGFNQWAGFYGGGADYFNRYDSWSGENEWWINRTFSPQVVGYTTDLIATNSLNFITANQSKSFFLYVPMTAVHTPMCIKLSDLQELCARHPGEWDYVKNLTSPTTGRRIQDVAELRCEVGEEFDYSLIDPARNHFTQIAYSTLAYSMDKAVGLIFHRLNQRNLTTNTIIWFASDNGAVAIGDNAPFRGNKHTLWEGGVHVPAAVWWPGHLCATNAPYSLGNNGYTNLTQYLDFYPTVMAMTGVPIQGTNLDGINLLPALQTRTAARTNYDGCYFGLDRERAVARNTRWKLHFNRVSASQKLELYDLQNDPGETTNVQASQPVERDTLIALLDQWFATGEVSATFMPLLPGQVAYADPAPSGDVLEIKATQTGTLSNPDSDGVYVRFAASETQDYDNYVHAGDQFEFDIYVAADSAKTSGFYCTPGQGWTPFFDSHNVFGTNSALLATMNWPKGKWVRQLVGIGNMGALPVPVQYLALRNQAPGYYHFYIDNVVLPQTGRHPPRSRLEQCRRQLAVGLYLQERSVHDLGGASAVAGFPFTNITLTTLSVTSITQPTVTNQSSSLTPASGAGIDYAVWAASTNAAVGTGNNSTTSNAQVGDIGTTGQVRRSVFGFDLEDTVMPAQLTAATLKLYYRGALGNATTAGGAVSLYHGSTLSIASGAPGTQLQATFGLTNWTDTGLNVIESPSAALGYYSVNVTSQVLADLTGDPARAADVMSHFLIRWDKEGTTNAYLTFDALEGTRGDPVLELTLAPAPVEGTSGQQFSTWADAVGGLTGYAPNEPGPTNPWPLLTEYPLGTDPTTLTLGLIPATPTNATEQLGKYQLQSLVVSNATNVYLTLQHNFNREADDIEIAFRESSNLVSWVEPLC